MSELEHQRAMSPIPPQTKQCLQSSASPFLQSSYFAFSQQSRCSSPLWFLILLFVKLLESMCSDITRLRTKISNLNKKKDRNGKVFIPIFLLLQITFVFKLVMKLCIDSNNFITQFLSDVWATQTFYFPDMISAIVSLNHYLTRQSQKQHYLHKRVVHFVLPCLTYFFFINLHNKPDQWQKLKSSSGT